MQLLGSVLFTTLLLVMTPLWGLVMFCVFFLPHRAQFALARTWAATLLWLLKFFCRLDYRVQGLENLPAGAHVALWKHSSSWETIAQMVILPPQVWVLKRELMWVPFVGWGLALTRPIAIDRSAGHAAVKHVVERGKKRIARGYWVSIFPEGTRMPAGETRKYGVSGVLLAQAAGCLMVPIAHNAGYFWPRRGLRKRPGTIRVVIGSPVNPRDRDPRRVNEELQAWVENQVRSMGSPQPRHDPGVTRTD
jgi:1-acyl-sn-glycerol-3-phosphate acyltransferase